ncbi:MAG: alanine--tRNA ligase-related protein, partial [Patescibacteria group bacterium]
MSSEEIRQKFLNFFEKRGHKIVSSSSLAPENDASVLFTTAGMQQFKPYYIGKASPMSDFGRLNACSIQKCIRTSDIEEVGDERHLTFFEMLGNFSFGGPTSHSSDGASYWKEDAIKYAHEFITKEMGLKIDFITVFVGEDGVPADTESEQIWKSIDSNITVKKFGRTDNFWGPTGEEGPCGPTTEIYVDGIEIWNIVFNEFYQSTDKSLKPLEIKGIDTGMGLERLAKVVQKVPTVFDTDLFTPLVSKMPFDIRSQRIVADHIRTAVFMIADGVEPSNTERGYILRRILRRVLIKTDKFNIVDLVSVIAEKYGDSYPEVKNVSKIKEVIEEEKRKFEKTLNEGVKELEKGNMDAFKLFTTFGFPLELTAELAKERGIEIDIAQFQKKMREHQEISKAGMEQKFKGGLGGHSDMEVKYHTATHLLHQALRDVLGMHVEQKGSNITPERLRFDFSHPQKMTEEEIKKVEEIVNQKIKEALPMNNIVLPKAEAEKSDALHFFGDLPAQAGKYG